MPSGLAALLKIVADIHRRGLYLGCAVTDVYMGHFAFDIQGLGIGIENKRAAIGVRNLGTPYLTAQLTSQQSHNSTPVRTAAPRRAYYAAAIFRRCVQIECLIRAIECDQSDMARGGRN